MSRLRPIFDRIVLTAARRLARFARLNLYDFVAVREAGFGPERR
jgi:hypothetical protein